MLIDLNSKSRPKPDADNSWCVDLIFNDILTCCALYLWLYRDLE